jgi:molybdopterin-guanine dinucleotide biosynthesis protein MobB
MPPVVSIVGKSKSGKTTLIEALISELKSRGHRIATIKHATHRLDFDKPNKDSWRHIQAGSDATVVVSPDQIVLIKPAAQESDLNKIARLLGEDHDIILTEGFKHSSAPKIEVHRKAVGPPLNHITNLIAIATDEPLETKTRQFSLHDVKGLADLLENSCIKPK